MSYRKISTIVLLLIVVSLAFFFGVFDSKPQQPGGAAPVQAGSSQQDSAYSNVGK